MYDTHTPAEWATYLSAGFIPVALLWLALASADAAKAAALNAAVSVAVLLMLLSHAPEGVR